AVGALWLYPGVHPVRLAEGAAGAVELRTRRGAGDGRLNAAADLSLLSAGASLDQRLGDGAAAWALSARRSSLDWLSRMVSDAADRPELRVPYGFWDVSGRADVRLGATHSLEASALRQGDRWRADPRGTSPSGDAAWGNVVARVSLVSASDRLESRQTLAFSSRSGHVRTPPVAVPGYAADPFRPDAAPRTTSELSYLALSGEWRTPAGRPTAWSFGYDAVRQQADYVGEKAIAASFPLAVASLPWEPDSMQLTGPALRVLGAWVEGTFTPWPRLSLQPALRLDAGDAVQGAGSVRPAPRMTARLELTPRVALSAGAARTWQYAQSLAPAGVRQATLSSDDAWLVAGPAVPALRADIVTGGVEAWLGEWRVTANGYGRKESGATIPDPRPGLAFAPRPIFVSATRYARGVELSGRRVAPRWSAYLGYSLARSELEAQGLVFPSGADQRHIFDASGLVRLAPALRAGAALTAASGTPYTPIVQEQIGADLVSRLGDPNSGRGKAYASLDLLLDWSARLGGREVGAWFQLKNALGRDNGVTYVSSRPGCVLGWCGPRAILENRYQRGLPRLPVLGIRARF
ncbi:MAG TPA: TonB-dependent receptor, partial [Longimicrobiales bacterium]